MKITSEIFSPLIHFFYPHNCLGCGSDRVATKDFLCLDCINDLPHTNFASDSSNPVEKKFWGRISLIAGMSEFYFSKNSPIQNLIHEMKYKRNKNVGVYLGNMMGRSLHQSNRFSDVDVIVPLPLFPEKEFRRGYNQAAILCQGIVEVFSLPVSSNSVARTVHTETQTKKGRLERWENVEKSFGVRDDTFLKGKHILLVDDVITTGATMEACGAEILKIEGTRLSVAALAFVTH